MGILTGRAEGIRLLPVSDLAFIGPLTDYSKGSYPSEISKYQSIYLIGMSTRSLPPTDHYTLEFEKIDQIRGIPIDNIEPHYHYMQTGSGGQIIDPKTQRLIPAPEPKRPRVGQLYLALLDEPQQIKQLIEITTDDIDSLRQAALKK
jgi:hypothetical protein